MMIGLQDRVDEVQDSRLAGLVRYMTWDGFNDGGYRQVANDFKDRNEEAARANVGFSGTVIVHFKVRDVLGIAFTCGTRVAGAFYEGFFRWYGFFVVRQTNEDCRSELAYVSTRQIRIFRTYRYRAIVINVAGCLGLGFFPSFREFFCRGLFKRYG